MTIRLPFVLFVLFVVVSSSSFAQTEISWDIETSKTVSVPRDIRRGENLVLLPRFLSYSTVTQLATNASIELYYRSADMSNGLYYVRTGSVHSATGGIARIPWTAAACGTATNYTYDIVVQTNGVVCNLRGYGAIRLLDGVYSQATTATNPTSWRTLDWSTISNLNLSSAPFPTSQTAVASYLTISGQPSDSTSLVAYVASQVSGISGGTATTIVHNVTDAGFLAVTNVMDSTTNRIRSLESGVLGLTNDLATTTNRVRSLESGVLACSNIAEWASNSVVVVSNAMQAGDLAGSQNVAAVTAALSNYVAAVALLNTNAWQAGDLAGSQNVASATAALSNYVAAVALLNTNAWQAGDLAGSNIATWASNSIPVLSNMVDWTSNSIPVVSNIAQSFAAWSNTAFATGIQLGEGAVAPPGGIVIGASTNSLLLRFISIGNGISNTPSPNAIQDAVLIGHSISNEVPVTGKVIVRSIAMGGNNYLGGTNNIVVGYGSTVTGLHSVAVGVGAVAGSSTGGSIQLGNGTNTTPNSLQVGNNMIATGGVICVSALPSCATIATNMLSWGFVDPAPTSAVQNVQWTPYFAATGTVRGIRSKAFSGTVICDVIKQNWTNALSSYTTIYTGATFNTSASNIPFTAAITVGDMWGVISTNVTTATNWWFSLEWTP